MKRSRANGTGGFRCQSWLSDRGATSLEFAIVGGLFVSLMLGSIELGRYAFTLESVRTVTAQAVRLATIRGSQNMNAASTACTNLSGNLSGAATRTQFLNPASLSVAMSGCATAGGVTTVTITVAYPFTFSVPFFGITNRPISETTQAIFN